MATIGFIGLGTMGFPMAGHLAAAGHDVRVYNRTRRKAEQWQSQYPGRIADTAVQAAQGAEFVLTCVGNDDDLRDVMIGPNGILQAVAAQTVLIDHTTVSASLAQTLYDRATAVGAHFLDAPVSGGQVGAEQGKLTIMCGGDLIAYERAEPVLAAYAREQQRMGPAGTGQLTKMVNQICVAGLLQGLAEGLHFGQCAGLDMHAVLDIISTGAAGSWQMSHRGKIMLDDQFDGGFAVDWMRKDLAICLAEAKHNGATLPVTALVDQFYADLQQRGGGRFDTSALLRRLTCR